jgi:DNA-binding NarL/FixJ family response regulator
MRIIIADDQVRVRAAVRLLLGQHPGLDIIAEVDRPASLLPAIKAMRPDLVLLDWELDGPQTPGLLAAIRRLSRPPLVAALSSEPEAREAALTAGADAFISKSDSPEQVLQTLRQLSQARH